MNIQHLKAFVLATQLGSVSAAARVMGKRQPQLSQWIAELEIDLGLKLFERSQNQISLSQAGESLLPVATLALAQCERFYQSAGSLAQHGTGTVILGVENYIPMEGLAPALSDYLRQFPDLDLILKNDSHEALSQAFERGECDLLLLHEDMALHQPDWGYCRVGEYEECILVAGTHPLSGAARVDPGQLAGYREWVWARGREARQSMELGFSGCYGLISDLQLLKRLLRDSDGFAFLPLSLVQAELADASLVRLQLSSELAPIKRRLELRWHHGFDSGALGGPLIELLKRRLL
ncbi:LysR family transcriptional regulator [Shewanella sp. AS16]|uniref:LysR family transcriptional regulator n=1 Tax=Shewanella sp. AS16 TaxID=2907625 RepID=UPI001F2811C7|nr:LysR family transcriptional regulator [Shewanella sp. AS16]MCE9685678.1 LysR family transcriptional regulator [Shewanella sp. AS16]